jgi:hypothetical protein
VGWSQAASWHFAQARIKLTASPGSPLRENPVKVGVAYALPRSSEAATKFTRVDTLTVLAPVICFSRTEIRTQHFRFFSKSQCCEIVIGAQRFETLASKIAGFGVNLRLVWIKCGAIEPAEF